MIIQWCLKGIPHQLGKFEDTHAQGILDGDAITSAWLRNVSTSASQLPWGSQQVLSEMALDQHVHDHVTFGATTPYVSLSAGCVERVATGVVVRHSALQTALAFATGGGMHPGYVFLCWVQVSPKPAPELPGFAEEIRDLNIYSPYSIFHDEGEIAAKLFVPALQIRSATYFDQNLVRGRRLDNPAFVPPERISNIMGLI